MSDEKTVLVRAFGGEPLIRRVVGVRSSAVIVSNPVVTDGSSMGFPSRDVFEMDARLAERLRSAYKSGSAALSGLWDSAVPYAAGS